MIGIDPATASYEPGTRFLTAVTRSDRAGLFGSVGPRVDLIHRVESMEGSSITTMDDEGATHVGRLRWNMPPDMGSDGEGRRRSVVWTDPMPDAPFPSIRAFADAMLRRRGYGCLPILAHVESVSAGRAVVRAVHQPATTEGTEDVEQEGIRIGAAVFSTTTFELEIRESAQRGPWGTIEAEDPLRNTKPGDLIVVGDAEFSMEDRLSAVSADVTLLCEGLDAAGVGGWMPDMTRIGSRRKLPIATEQHMARLMEKAVQSGLPDEILVVAASGGAASEKAVVELARTGPALFDVDCVVDDLEGLILEDGLWIGGNVRWVDAGEDGAEWRADWRPALQEDLDRHGVDRSDAEEAISEHLAEWSPRT